MIRNPPNTRHTFEGEELTISEIHLRVPALSRSAIVRYIRQGHTTRVSMLSVDSAARRSAGGKRGRVVAVANGFRECFKS